MGTILDKANYMADELDRKRHSDIITKLLKSFDLKLFNYRKREAKRRIVFKDKLEKADKIEEIINRLLKIDAISIREKTRIQEVKDKRCICMTLIQELVPLGSTTTGMIFGLNHGTCIHARKVVSDLIATNPKFKADYEKVRNGVLNEIINY